MSWIFVFGSNTQGRHGAGAAHWAVEHYGAIYGQAEGRQGQSYAIITKELRLNRRRVGLRDVKRGVKEFLTYAAAHPELNFHVTRIGCGLAGFEEEQIAPMFALAPDNCYLPTSWTWTIRKRFKLLKKAWQIEM